MFFLLFIRIKVLKVVRSVKYDILYKNDVCFGKEMKEIVCF